MTIFVSVLQSPVSAITYFSSTFFFHNFNYFSQLKLFLVTSTFFGNFNFFFMTLTFFCNLTFFFKTSNFFHNFNIFSNPTLSYMGGDRGNNQPLLYASHPYSEPLFPFLDCLLQNSEYKLYPLTLKSDWHLVFPYNISPESNIKVMRTREMINN